MAGLSGGLRYGEGFHSDHYGGPRDGKEPYFPVRSWAGVMVNTTRGLDLRAALGYAGALTGDTSRWYQDLHVPLARLQARFLVWAHARLVVGYQHDLRESPVCMVEEFDAAYLHLTLASWARFELSMLTAWTFARYHEYYLGDDRYYGCITVPGSIECRREDHYLVAHVGLGYTPRRWLTVSIGYAFQALMTDMVIHTRSSEVGAQFLKHRVYLRVATYY